MANKQTHVIRDSVVEGQYYKSMARLVDITNTNLTTSTVDSVTLEVFEQAAPDTDLITQPTLTTESDSIKDTLVTSSTDGAWESDETGYNFVHIFDWTDDIDGGGTALTTKGGQQYRLQYTINTTAVNGSGPVFVTTILDITAKAG